MSTTSRERDTQDVIVDACEDMDIKEKERLTSVAKSMTESLLAATDLLGGIPWCLVHEKHGISLFRADVTNDVPCNVHAVNKFYSDIEDVAESMITNTTESYKNMMSMLSSDFLDGAVIQNIVEPTELNPHRYVALKWAAFKSSSRFGKDRDFIILEYVDMIEDDQGQKIAFRIMESVDVPNNSPYAESARYTRDVVPLMGFMYHTTKKPGELRLTYTCNFDKNGDLPAWAANSAIQSHVEKCITGIVKYIETFRAGKEEFVLPQQVIPMNEQDHCHVCEKNFCVLRRKYNCLKCGEVICSNCSSLRTAIVPDVGERQLRVCTACVIAVRRSSKTPAPSDGMTVGSPLPASRAPSTATVDSDVTSVRSGNAAVCRTQSFSHGKRRSLDDVLDPVRSRLIEYKTFSDGADAIPIPKASFPARSFSDGIIKGSLFQAKRRGSPADLAISLEAFRQHQMRMGNGDQQAEDGEPSDEEAMEQLQYFSTSSTGSTASSTGSSHARVAAEEALAPAYASRRTHERRNSRGKAHSDEEQGEGVYAVPASLVETRTRFHEAMEKTQGIIEAAEYANNLAQHARKLSHHRILALQREHHALRGVSSNEKSDNDSDCGPEVECDVSIIPPARVRRAVCQTKNGTVLYGKNPTMDLDPQVQVITRGMAELQSNQCVDVSFRRQMSGQNAYTVDRTVHGGDSGRYH